MLPRAINKLIKSPKEHRTLLRSSSRNHLLDDLEDEFSTEKLEESAKKRSLKVQEQNLPSKEHRSLSVCYSVEPSPKVLQVRRMGLSEEHLLKDIIEIRSKLFIQTLTGFMW